VSFISSLSFRFNVVDQQNIFKAELSIRYTCYVYPSVCGVCIIITGCKFINDGDIDDDIIMKSLVQHFY